MTHDNSSRSLFVRIKGRVEDQSMQIPFIFSPISAGFPSPALDFMDKGIDLNKILIKNVSATFLGQVAGNSMMKIGISDGDYIIIDKSSGILLNLKYSIRFKMNRFDKSENIPSYVTCAVLNPSRCFNISLTSSAVRELSTLS